MKKPYLKPPVCTHCGKRDGAKLITRKDCSDAVHHYHPDCWKVFKKWLRDV